MRKTLTLLLALLPALTALGQMDTTALRIHSLQLAPAVTSVALTGTGALLTYVPAVSQYAIDLRNAVVEADLPRIHVDDYLQYVPAAVPLALSLAGVKGRHSTGRMALLEGGSYLLGAGWLNAFKYKLGILRPDGTTYNSFPSGHTFMAFTGAELVRREYGESHPWVAAAAYPDGATVAIMRIYNNRHWAGDVLAGAGLGILSVTLVYWALD